MGYMLVGFDFGIAYASLLAPHGVTWGPIHSSALVFGGLVVWFFLSGRSPDDLFH